MTYLPLTANAFSVITQSNGNYAVHSHSSHQFNWPPAKRRRGT